MDLSTKLLGDFCVACAIAVVVILSIIIAATILWVSFIST